MAIRSKVSEAVQPAAGVVEKVTAVTRAGTKVKWYKSHSFRNRVGQVFIILLLVDVGFIFVVPILRMISTSFMDIMDLYDPTVVWMPRRWAFENYLNAVRGLAYFPKDFFSLQAWKVSSLFNTVFLTLVTALLQTLMCAVAGYGFARFKFPGREYLFLLVLFAMIVPPHAVIIQLFLLVSNLKPFGFNMGLNTYWPFILQTVFGMGLRGALFVFIYRQFFKGLPWELEDAAMIDGAGPLRIFLNVMLPLAQPAFLVVFLFSFVWHWNDSLEPAIYLSKQELFTLPMRLTVIETALESFQMRGMWGTGTIMAAALLVILPLLILYLFTQRYFVESIERTGLID
jgi:multiple sugar transport system permease protein